jgi:parallel beta-helix repeat protein
MTNRIKKKQILNLIFAIGFSFFLIFQIANSSPIAITAETNTNPDMNIQYWTEGIVVSDANITTLSSSGTGTEGDPYIIDNLHIDTASGIAIEFDGVSLSTYWTLRDSTLITRGTTYGVYISDNIDGKGSIINCTIEGDLTIGTPNAKYLTVHNNTLRYRNGGANYNKGLTYTNNILYADSPFSTKLMRLRDEDNTIKNNIFYGNNSQITLNNVLDSTFENNVFHDGGFNFNLNSNIAETTSNTFVGNTINGKPFGFFFNETGETISTNQYGQIFLLNSINTKIADQSLTGALYGIQIHYCTDVTVDNVEITGKSGIVVRETTGLEIKNSNLEGYSDGIDISNVFDIALVNNVLTGYSYGIDIFYGFNLEMSNNTLLECGEFGIYLEDSDNIEMKFNIVTVVVEDAGNEPSLILWGCTDVIIYYNVFINLGNNTASPVAGSGSSNIKWYNETLEVGNHYSDWNQSGAYNIPGGDGSIDLYPFIDIDGDDLTENAEVVIFGTNPFEADSDGDGFDDLIEISEGTDPLDPKDYPGKGRVLAIVLGLIFGLGIPAGLIVFARTTKGQDILKKLLKR